jgi:hypothetical protein
MAIPEELISTVSEDERILFISENLITKRMKKKRRKKLILEILICIIILYSVPGGYIIWEMINGYFYFFSYCIFLLIPLVGVLMLPLYFKSGFNKTKNDKYILITDKAFYINTYVYEGKNESVDKIELNSIIDLIYEKEKYDDKNKVGNLTIIREILLDNSVKDQRSKAKRYLSFHTIHFIPEFEQFQVILESILLEFGNIRERWDHLKNSANIEFPIQFQVSEEKLYGINKKLKIYSIIIFILSVGSIIWSSIFVFLIIKEFLFPSEDQIMYLVMFFLLLPIIPSIVIAFILKMRQEMELMKIAGLGEESKLIIDENDIILKEKNKIMKISIGKLTNISYIKIKNPFDDISKWKESVDGIMIRPTHSSEKQIAFGPIENVSYLLSLIFYHIIIKKGENGFLYSKSQLLKNQIRVNELQSIETTKTVLRSKVDRIEKKTFNFEKLIPEENLEEINKYIESGDYIVLQHIPKISFMSDLIIFIHNVLGFIGAFYLAFIIIPEYRVVLRNLAILLLMVPIGGFCFHSCIFSEKRNRKTSRFFFTTEKIIQKTKKQLFIIKYQNIESIGKSRFSFQYKTYDIELNLRTPLPNNRFLNKFSLIIPNVPKGDLLIDKIRYLKENSVNIKEE